MFCLVWLELLVWSYKYLRRRVNRVALFEFSIVIIILSTSLVLSICCPCNFMFKWLPIVTSRNFIDQVSFSGWTYIVIDVSLYTFLWEKLIWWDIPGFKWLPGFSCLKQFERLPFVPVFSEAIFLSAKFAQVVSYSLFQKFTEAGAKTKRTIASLPCPQPSRFWQSLY